MSLQPLAPPGSDTPAPPGARPPSAPPTGSPVAPRSDPSPAPSSMQPASTISAPSHAPSASPFPVRTPALDSPLFAPAPSASPPTSAVNLTSSSSSSSGSASVSSPAAPHVPPPTLPITPPTALFGAPQPAPVKASPPVSKGPALFTPANAATSNGPSLFTPVAAASSPLGAPPLGPPKGGPAIFTPGGPLQGPHLGTPLGPPPVGVHAAPFGTPLGPPPVGGPPLHGPSLGPPLCPPLHAAPLGPPPVGGAPLHAASLQAPPHHPASALLAPPTGPVFLSPQLAAPPHQAPAMGIPSAAPTATVPKGSVRIEPAAMPSPMALHTNRILDFKTRSSGCAPPPSVMRFYADDEGVASPHFLRSSMYSVPTTSSLVNQSCIPFGAVVTPFAEDIYGECRPPELVTDLKDKDGHLSPPRCIRCKAYPSPQWVWLDGGRSFRCNICESVNDTPPEYFSPTDPSGHRSDLHQRPELRCGAVEFAVGPEYHHKKERAPAPLSMLFLVEVTSQAVRTGVLESFCNAFKALLPTLPKHTRLGIATFDTAVHYYALQKGQTQPRMLVMADHTAGFLPASRDSFLVPFDDDHRSLVETLLNKLPVMWANNTVTHSATGAALQSAILALRSSGGRIVLLQTSMPSVGAGALRPRFDSKLLGTEKETALFAPPEGNNFWADLGSKCSEMKITVDTILLSDASIDLPSQHGLTRSTCGQYFWMPPPRGTLRDEAAFAGALHRILHRSTAQDVVLRVRCCKGLTVNEFLCNYHASAFPDEAELAGVDSDKAIAFTFKHEEELSDKKEASFQVALLYTSKEGLRRVRVFNSSIPTTTVLQNVFRLADLDTTLTLLARQAVMLFWKERSLHKVRTFLTNATVALLSSYRQYCSPQSSNAQLILPEALKLIPAYVLGLMKHTVFRPSIDTLPDERFHWLNFLMNEAPPVLMNLLYPRLYALHRLPDHCGVPAQNGSVMLPPALRLAQESIEPFGVYLIADDTKLTIWIARNAPEELLRDAFAVTHLDQLDTRLHVLPIVDTSISSRIHTIISELRRLRPGLYPSLHLVRQRDITEVKLFASALVEEKITAGDPYTFVDWLCYLHKEIMNKISNDQRAAASLENFNLFN